MISRYRVGTFADYPRDESITFAENSSSTLHMELTLRPTAYRSPYNVITVCNAPTAHVETRDMCEADGKLGVKVNLLVMERNERANGTVKTRCSAQTSRDGGKGRHSAAKQVNNNMCPNTCDVSACFLYIYERIIFLVNGCWGTICLID